MKSTKRKVLIIIWKLLFQVPKSIWFLISIGVLVSFALIWYSIYLAINIFFEKTPAYGGTLREGFYQPIDTLNPFLAEKSSEKTLINLIFDSLIRPDGKGGYEYELAKSITKINQGLAYEIELKDAYWSNGNKINADDVIATFNYIKKYSNGDLYEMFKEINFEKIDNYRIKVSLPIKDNYFIQKLSFVKIIPYKIWSRYEPAEWKSKEADLISVSSGPFIFNRKYTKGDIEIYEFIRNPFYQPQPYLDKVLIYVYSDINKAYEALKSKEIDALGGIKPTYFLSISPRSFKVYKIIIPRVIGIFFNSGKVKSIEKINQLKKYLNRDEIIKETFEEFAEPSFGILSPSIAKIYKLGYEKPKNEIINANLDFSDTNLIVPDNFYFQKIGIYLSKVYKFKIKLESLENIINSIIPEKNYEALLMGISYNLPPDLSFLFNKNSNLNLTNVEDIEISKIIQEMKTGDENKFYENLENLNKKIQERLPVVFIGNNYYPYILPQKLKGFDIQYLNSPEEKFVKIEKWYINERIKW